MAVGRIDYQLSDKNSVFGRYLADSNVSPPAYTLNNNVLSPENGIDGLTQAFTIGDTYLWGANIVNSLRLSANRWVGGRTGVDYAGWPEQGVKMFSYQPKHLSAAVTGGFSISNGGVGAAKMALFGGNDDLSIVHRTINSLSERSWPGGGSTPIPTSILTAVRHSRVRPQALAYQTS